VITESPAGAPRRSSERFRRRTARARTTSPILEEASSPPAVRRRDATFRRWLLGADVLAAFVALAIAQVPTGLAGPGLPLGLVLVAAVPVVFTCMGLYQRDELVISTNTLDEAPVLFQAATLAAVAAFLVESVIETKPLGAQLIAATMVALFCAATLLRAGARAIARATTTSEHCLMVGGAEMGERLRAKLESGPAINATFVGRLELTDDLDARALGRAIRDRDVHRVVVAGEAAAPERVHDVIQAAKALGVKVSVLPRMFEVVGSSVAFDYLGGLTMLGVRRFGLTRRQRTVKRAFDLAGSLVLVVLFSPLMAALALAVRLTSPGPVFFRQTRVGRGGQHFRVYKFRSMVADAEARKADLREANEADGLFKIAADPRITRIGRLLRKTSLDELPQLLNVLRGEMSIVGPRPLIVDEDRRIEGYYRRRLHLTPGMTGHWQVLGSARIPLREMVSIDYLYVANWSLWNDVKILLRTIPVVIGRRGQ
jgi:exopolysaccharide biosynthesis polyprenyl glycosylphosphotransferase